MAILLPLALGLAQGYVKKKEADEDRAYRAELREERRAEQALRMRSAQREEDDRIALSDAARPVAMEQGAGGAIRAPSADDRDVDGTAATLDQAGAYRVGGKTFADKGGADIALAQANSEDAVLQRSVKALRDRGRVSESIALQNSVTSKRNADMAMADKEWRRRIGTALQGDEDGMAELLTQLDVGPLAGKRAKAVRSADGSTVNYHVVNPDGSTTPTPYTFPAGREGLIQAGYMLDRAITPEQRYTHWTSAQKAAEQRARDERRDANTERHQRVMETNSGLTAQAAMLRATRAGGDGEGGGKAPSGFRWKPDGSLEAIPGGPGDKKGEAKPMPSSAAKGHLENITNLRRAEKALALVQGLSVDGATGDTDATGKKGWLPNQLLNRMDPAGVDTRASIADL
ncbi:MAG: hypothetical protein EOO24_45315, partial [Comamonadaceae bacterium]